jgi:hypothetical protein
MFTSPTICFAVSLTTNFSNRVSVVSPEVLFLPEDFYSLDLLVVPLWGLYANMIAQLISQISSHYIIYYHRRIVQEARKRRRQNKQSLPMSPHASIQDISIQRAQKGDVSRVSVDVSPGGSESVDSSMPQKMSLHRHQFGRPHRGETEKLIVRPWVNKGLLASAFCMVLFIIIGCSIPSFSLEILGIIGVAVESGQNFQDATTHHSVFTVVQLLFEEADFLGTAGDYFGLGTLSLLFVFTVLLVPIVQSIALLRQWLLPSTREESVRMSVIVEILQAWQYAEVYLIAIFVASWQLGPVSEFMINSYCDSLKETFAELVYFGILKEEDAQCFSVRSSIEGGSFLLVIAALLLTFLSTFVTKAAVQYLRDQGEVEKRIRDEEDSLFGSEVTSPTDDDNMEEKGMSARIHPAPVLFTDSFRWLLYQENNHWGLPDTQYHWDSPSNNAAPTSSRAMFLPEARVLAEEEPTAVPGQYPKAVSSFADSKDEKSIGKGSSRSVSTARLVGYRAKRPSYGKDDQQSVGKSVNSKGFAQRASLKDDRSYDSGKISSSRSERSFKDEASVTSSPSIAELATGTASRSIAAYKSVHDTVEEESMYEEEVISLGGGSEYEEMTIDEGYEEYTVMSGIVEDELEDIVRHVI